MKADKGINPVTLRGRWSQVNNYSLSESKIKRITNLLQAIAERLCEFRVRRTFEVYLE